MSEYVPVTELGEESEGSQIRWNFALPPALDAERITVNMDRLHRLQRIGGIAASVVYDYQGERTEFTPGITGINADGTAVATKAGTVRKAEDRKTLTIDLFPPYLERQFGKVAVGHGINKAELASVISDQVRTTDDPREKLWATQLDRTLRQSFRDAGKEHLVRRSRLFVQVIDSFWLSSGVAAVAGDILTQQSDPWLALYPGVWSFNLGIQLLVNRKQFGHSLVDQRRWSMVPNSFQPDRYLALTALSRVPGLIKAKK